MLTTIASSSPRRTARSSAAHSIRSSRVTGNSRPFGVPAMVCPERPTRCRSVAMRCGEPIWQTRSTWPMSMPSSSDAVATSALQRAGLQPRFGVEPLLLRQAAVVRGDRLVAEPLAQVPRHPLRHAPRVDEHQRRAMRCDQLRRGGRSTPPRPRATSPLRAASAASRRRDPSRGDALRRRSAHGSGSAPCRRGTARPPRSASASPTGRCAAAAARRPAAGARATARGARRAACRSPRGSRRR